MPKAVAVGSPYGSDAPSRIEQEGSTRRSESVVGGSAISKGKAVAREERRSRCGGRSSVWVAAIRNRCRNGRLRSSSSCHRFRRAQQPSSSALQLVVGSQLSVIIARFFRFAVNAPAAPAPMVISAAPGAGVRSVPWRASSWRGGGILDSRCRRQRGAGWSTAPEFAPTSTWPNDHGPGPGNRSRRRPSAAAQAPRYGAGSQPRRRGSAAKIPAHQLRRETSSQEMPVINAFRSARRPARSVFAGLPSHTALARAPGLARALAPIVAATVAVSFGPEDRCTLSPNTQRRPPNVRDARTRATSGTCATPAGGKCSQVGAVF